MNKNILLSALVTILIAAFFASDARAQCTEFPDYQLWKTLTHDRARSYVKRRLNGNWIPYISHLEKQLKTIEKINASGKAARLKHKGEIITLRGDKLSEYENASRARLQTVQCLADEQEAAELNNFSTAAGDEQSDESPVTEVQIQIDASSPGASQMKLEISTSCSNGVSRFKIQNQGPDWPKAGSFSIFRIEGTKKYPVSARRMRLKQGQIASFTVKKSRNLSGHLGLFVEPTWYTRPFEYDATLSCR